MPQNAVTAIIQTRDGYLWLGTYGGLVRFDGVRFTVVDGSTAAALKSCRVTCLYEDPSRTLWVGQETGEVTRYKDGRFEAVEAPRAGKERKLHAIGSDEAGDIWVLNEEGILGRVKDGLVLVPPAGNAAGQVMFSQDEQGHIRVVRHGKASRLVRGHLTTPDFAQDSPESYVQGVCPSRQGGLWVASDGQLRKWQDNRWKTDLGAAPWGFNGLTVMRETQSGYVLAGTVEQGLYVVVPEQTNVLHFTRTNALPQNWVRSFWEDREENLWVGAGSAGLAVLREGKVSTLNPPDRWQGRAVLSVATGQSHDLWVGTEGAGLYHYADGQWEQFGEAAGLLNQFVWSITRDKASTLWAGTWGGGVFKKTDKGFERVPGLENVTAPAPALFESSDGSMWIGTANALLRYKAGAVSRFGEAEGLDFPDVRTFAESVDGTIWFGMFRGGLGCFRDGELKQFGMKDGLSSDLVQALYAEKDGTLWVGTGDSGLNRYKQGKFTAITRREGLPDNVICHIEQDSHGYFWLASHGGIIRISKAELDACADGAAHRVNCLTYGKGEGLPTLECTGGLQPSGCATSDGRIWIPTSKGLVVVDPNEVKTNQLAPPVYIERVLVDGQEIGKGAATADSFAAIVPGTNSAPLRIAPGRQRFEFQYTGLSLTVPEKVRFKYRLEGLENDWVEAGDGGTKRSANYSYIPPGPYTFHVIACNNDGVWNEQGASVRLEVLPFFWQTWLFKGASGLAAGAVVAGSALGMTRRRMRHKLEGLERQRAVERERTRIAKDIHDDLGASLTRITLLSQSARSELEQASPASSDIDRIYDTARELTRAMDEIVWAVNPQHDSLDSLATYLGRFAQDFLAAARIRCRLEVPTELPAWPLTADIRHNLFLAFKEALNNSVKHSGTKEVRIVLEIGDGDFVLSVEDQGSGFVMPASSKVASAGTVPDRFASGNGLLSMRQRLADIGGRCEIQSWTGKNGDSSLASPSGTRVTFMVPVKVQL